MLVLAAFKTGEGERAAVRIGLVIRPEHIIDCSGLMFRCSNGAEAVLIIQVLVQGKRTDKGNKQEDTDGANPLTIAYVFST